MKFSKFFFGTDYYPEHWPEERWSEDAKLMKAAGFNIVRLAEFAWAKIETREGHFNFDWLDRAIDILAELDIQIVLGTPTASPPPWLMAKDGELFIVKENGVRLGYGNRREYCPNHPLYHQHTERIVTQMAERYKDHPAVIGWQIDNEFGARCFCDICRGEFHKWLQTRYANLDEVNEKWGTIFWGHVYGEWSQIPVPVQLGYHPMDSSPNPGLALDYFRFMSDVYVTYQDLQMNILREKCPKHFITHNFMGFKYKNLNYFDLAKNLDFVSWDNYARMQWTMDADVDPSNAALNHDAMRGLKKQNFWVMEQQSGPGGWEHVAAATKPGELRLWAYQGIAHGADGIIFFRWRTCRFGTEQYWHGVLNHHGIPGRRYEEIARMGAEISLIGEQINGAVMKPAVAIMQSYDARFAFQIQQVNPKLHYEQQIGDIYKAFHTQNIGVDIVSEKDRLSGYKLVIVPLMYVLSEETITNLERFAEKGGMVVLTGLTGVKNLHNAVVNMKLPGLAAKMSGIEVEEYLSLPEYEENEIKFSHVTLDGNYPVPIWADVLSLQQGQPIGHYSKDFIADQPAASLNEFGKGKVLYLGALGNYEYYKDIAQWLVNLAGIESPIAAPDGVEVTVRWKGNRRLLFILNHTQQEHNIHLENSYSNVLNGEIIHETVGIPPFGVLILSD
ncbi:MAG: cellulase family glycosylhydrolase [Anaerolineales bacterium]|nr:cellulase family glycosylhydrolase [Anaerolineales bacterium]